MSARPTLKAALLSLPLLLATSAAVAQTPSTPQTSAPQTATQSRTGANAQGREAAADASTDEADISITARVTARELRFEKVPNPRVEFTGKPERTTAWEAERENLPEQVQPGVTYRDIGVRLRITSVFADIDRIVAEALGEFPVSEDAPPAPQPEAPRRPLIQQPPEASAPASPPQASPEAAPPATSRRATRQKGSRKGTTR